MIPIQHMPNLELGTESLAIRLEDLVADVADGILIEGGDATSDFQGRTGLLEPGGCVRSRTASWGRNSSVA